MNYQIRNTKNICLIFLNNKQIVVLLLITNFSFFPVFIIPSAVIGRELHSIIFALWFPAHSTNRVISWCVCSGLQNKWSMRVGSPGSGKVAYFDNHRYNYIPRCHHNSARVGPPPTLLSHPSFASSGGRRNWLTDIDHRLREDFVLEKNCVARCIIIF